jgi:anion-transporting  ArsA/GET3 family ATPase
MGGRRGARVLNVASRPFYQLADRILGSQFLQDIAEFFLSFQSMYEGFTQRAQAVERLLHDRRTTFAVVTTLEGAPLREAQLFCEQLIKRDFHLGALVLNKTLPDYLLSPDGARAADALAAEAGPLAEVLAGTGSPELADAARTARVLRTIGESFKNFAVVAKREAELKSELSRVPDVVVNVPNFEVDIYDVSGLARIGDCLFES